MFRKYHPRSGSTEYYLVDSVQRQEVPVGGYLIRIPGPPENLMASRSYSVVRRNEYADSNLMPHRWGPCSAEEGREALKMLLEAGYDVIDLEELIFNPDWLAECLEEVLGVMYELEGGEF